jgi:hypothetical protein
VLVFDRLPTISSDYKGRAIPRKRRVLSFRLRNRERTAAPRNVQAAREATGFAGNGFDSRPIGDFCAEMKRYHC